MTEKASQHDLFELLGALCNGHATEEQHRRLALLLKEDDAARQMYVRYLDLHLALADVDLVGCDEADAKWFAGVDSLDNNDDLSDVFDLPSLPHNPAPTCPPIYQNPRSTMFDFSCSSWPVAYLIATVIMGIGAFIGTVTYVSHPVQVVQSSTPLPSPHFPLPTTVARVTGMVDCVFQGSGTRDQGTGSGMQNSPLSSLPSPLIRLGDTFHLVSGLLEITYQSGAKVILQGPVTYKVDADNGGFLFSGKLTALVEKRGEGRGERDGKVASGEKGVGSGQWAVGSDGKMASNNQQSTINNQQSSSPSLATSHQPLFTITTPTATVIDLGTEFGVEVDANQTRTYVLQGRVSLQSSSSKATDRILMKGESASVDAQGTIAAHSADETADFAHHFIRSLPMKNRPVAVSLTDLVAGGDGFGCRSSWGINPLDASMVIGAHPMPNQILHSTGEYQRYNGSPCIDGVFVPDGSQGPVRLDSAGHTFALPKTSGDTVDWGVWGYRGKPWEAPRRERPSAKTATDLSSMIFLPTNVGVTFNLAAIRAAAAGSVPVRFVTSAQNCPWTTNAPFKSKVDLWVFVDGQLRFKRLGLCAADGSQGIDVSLEPTARFLTLVATESDDGPGFDELCLLDPRVLLDNADRLEPATSTPGKHK